MARSQHEVAATLGRGLQRPGTIMALTGEAGLGKTVLLQHVLAGSAAGPVRTVDTAGDLLGEWNALLDEGGPAGRGVLIVEDAHAAQPAAMAGLAASLARTDPAGRPHVVFVAWPRFWPGLVDPALASLRDAIAVRAVLFPMTYAEAEDYLGHLFRLAGGSARTALGADRLHALLLSTEGNPRRINVELSRVLRTLSGATTPGTRVPAVVTKPGRSRLPAAFAGITVTIAVALLAIAVTDLPLSFESLPLSLPRYEPANLPPVPVPEPQRDVAIDRVPTGPAPTAAAEPPPAPAAPEPPAVEAEPPAAAQVFPPETAVAPPPVDPALAPAAAPPPAPVLPRSQPNALPASVVTSLVRRGDAMMDLRDVSAARRLYGRAAVAGNARAALLLGGTFDPAHGATPETGADTAAAEAWYSLAASLGDADAPARLQALTGGRTRE